ncbi:MAG: hypothetical protein A2821_03650 [Candidatus Magasanikbacteria bacterium RIFCSPHIGHO2_01_FULL_41_23]|uniref:Uncharacterized protein n=1 Tax=Candidatus Magasanikbacteria bacterium RIFCSPLOWO2_01_FULL_40_15 TaxID=1798686 RepID=A0A1F6N4Y5_9BACT|nr:MAG: hypothetical protein A2821_03650 [Candidatus Magasanikbacteria bacterium RIFCSPHIGHO2_01_FULL_41_23]OGH66597.1 MAG: hypothetical protein A3C66_03010 [Candidatus Magasanikbacteria bacterium RIFCSPHIGHO2_02_FULL_41_35]OGH78788.1 MAG: hypothetical protein A2983_00395 [Candidatus Magasanikbacteria bacterium RIFCSPLOWO2_01_FULL_40_15]
MKDFSEWHNIKHKIENFQVEKLFHDREIWWCSLGSNIGFEQDGKNAKYERPILIFRKFSKGMFWGLPLTSKEKDDIFHHKIILHLIDQNEKPQEKISRVILSQLRLLSAKRLIRRVARINEKIFAEIEKQVINLILEKENGLLIESSGALRQFV